MSNLPQSTSVAVAMRPQTFEQLQSFSRLIAESSFVPKDYRGKPGDVLAAVMHGAEIGLAPMQALQGIAVVNGRPCVWGDALLGLVLAHPDCLAIEESDDGETALCVVRRRNRPAVERSFSQADAKAAGLAGKDGPWRNYPRRMRQMRARAFALRDSFADVLRGLSVAEEAQDIEPTPVAAVIAEPKRLAPAPSETVETVEAAPVAAPTAVAPPDDALRVRIVNSHVEQDTRGDVYTFLTSDGVVVTRDRALYDLLSPLEGTDHEVEIATRIGRRADGTTTRVLRAAALVEPVEAGEAAK